MTIIDAELRSCKKCERSFEPRSGSGGSVQRFCSTRCRLSFHTERLRFERRGLYAGQSPEPATQEPATVFEQAERLIARLTPDERRRFDGETAPRCAKNGVPGRFPGNSPAGGAS
jgi:hypothetical protein